MDLPSVLGGAVQGFKDFGKSALDLFGGGGANILDIIESLQTGKLTSRRQDDFRKWLYNTDDTQDAAAKGLGTALNGIQTISDYIPGLNAVSQNPLFNAGQGALGGIADEFKMYGKDADLGRAGQRALVSGGAALASSGLGNYIGSSASPLATSNTLKGAARGALGGAINQGGYTAIEGGNLSDILSSAGQGASMGGLIGGATGMFQDFKPAKTYDAPLTDNEKAALIANAKNMLAKEQRPERIAELNAQIEKLGGNDPQAMQAIDAVVAPEKQEMVTLYRGMSAPDAPTLKKYLDDMRNPDIEPRQYAGASLFGRGYNATESLKEATGYAKSSDNGPAMGVFSIKLPKDSFVQMTEDAGNRERDFIIRAHDKYGGYHPEIDPKFNPEAMAQGKKDFMDYLIKNNIAGSVSDGGTYTIMNPQMTSGFKVKKLLPEAENYLKQNGYKSLEDIKNDPQVMEAIDAIIDSAGENIPQPMAKYFDDVSPLVRDENGNLIRFYHGTPNGDFESPRGGSYFTPDKSYADVYQSPNASSISYGKQANNPATYEAYLDLRKPFELSDPEARRIYIDEYIKGGNATGINPYQNNYDDIKNIDWTEVEGLKEYLEGTGYGYDSIIADEGGVPDGNGGVISRGKSYIPFESSQIFTLKKNLAQPIGSPVTSSSSDPSGLGLIDMSRTGENSKYFMDKYGDAIANAGASDNPEAMKELMLKRGNKNMVRDAFSTQQDSANGNDIYRIFREYGGGKPAARETLANALTGASDNPPELIGYHGVDSEKLKKAINNFGGDIINPSLQIVNPEVNPGTKYGDVILLGNKDMYFNQGKYGLIDDTGKTNAYSRDVYSPRVPDFEEKNGNRYIAGTRTPYTSENVSKYMNKQGIKAVESNWATPGSVAATQSHRFTDLSDILNYADKLGPKDANKKAFDDFGEFLSNKVWDYAEKTGHMGDNPYISVDNITTEIQDALNGRYMPDDFYGLRTPDGQKLLDDIRKEINKLPTDYFELKMNRPVGLKEFSGAILPEGYNDKEVLDALKNAGVEVLGDYDQNNMDSTLQETLKNLTKNKNRFKTPYMLGLAGLLGGGAYMASQENNKDKEIK